MKNSVGKAIRSINKDGLNPTYFLLGSDSFLQKFFIKNIENKYESTSKVKYLNLNEESDLLILFDQLKSIDMFSSKNIFAVRNFTRISKSNQLFIKSYLDNPNLDNILIFIVDDFKVDNKFSKVILDKSISIDTQTPFFNNKIKEWVNYYLKIKKYTIDNQYLDFLIDNYSDDLSNIINEIEKIKLFDNSMSSNKYNDDVSYNGRHIQTWNLLDSLGEKDNKKSIYLFEKLLLNGISLIPILISLYNLYVALLDVNDDRKQYNGLNKIINSKLVKYRTNYQDEEISDIILELRNLDMILKSTSISEDLLFSNFIIKICDGYYSKK